MIYGNLIAAAISCHGYVGNHKEDVKEELF